MGAGLVPLHFTTAELFQFSNKKETTLWTQFCILGNFLPASHDTWPGSFLKLYELQTLRDTESIIASLIDIFSLTLIRAIKPLLEVPLH